MNTHFNNNYIPTLLWNQVDALIQTHTRFMAAFPAYAGVGDLQPRTPSRHFTLSIASPHDNPLATMSFSTKSFQVLRSPSRSFSDYLIIVPTFPHPVIRILSPNLLSLFLPHRLEAHPNFDNVLTRHLLIYQSDRKFNTSRRFSRRFKSAGHACIKSPHLT